jgi:peptidoglycan/LPS O-acetylase OafA/YrhL
LLAAKLLGLGITVILAWASYRWLESPFLRWKDRFARVLSRPV